MTVIELLRLIRKHIVLLILTPVLLALLVVLLTRKPTYKFSSETTLYTGIASGSSVEMDKSFSYFANNTAFDNLINIITSRQTQQEVAIRLLAQHLMMDRYDPKYISKESFQELQRLIPSNIRKLVVKKNTNVQGQPESIENDSPEETPSEKDNSPVKDKFSFESLDSSVTVLRQPAFIDQAAFEETVINLEKYMNSSDTNSVYKLLYYEHPHYSIKAIASVNVQRIASSDLVKIKFDSDDPGICQQTLAFLTGVCIKNYKLIKENRSDAVVKYFEYQMKQAAARLKIGEDKLLKFNEDNNIINYYEQSKAVAVVKEDLDVDYNNKRIKLAGYDAAIKRIEEKLGKQKQVQLSSTSIIDKRNQLSEINSKIATAETMEFGKTIDEEHISELKQSAEKLKEEIKSSVNDLYNYGNTPEGLPISTLLNEWITNVIGYEDTKAGLEVLGERIKEFQKQYAIYAPAGANIKRIEREISVSEQEFLEILHGLNLAKLKLQDAELSSTIKTVDPPYFPLSPNPTNRKILVLAAALIGFLLVLSFILAMEYFDETLKNSDRAAKKLKLRILGIFPKIFLNTGTLNFPFIVNRLLDMLIQQINLLTPRKTDSVEPRIIIFMSTGNYEGKTITAGDIARKLKSQGFKVLYLNFSSESLREEQVKQLGYPSGPRGVPKPGTASTTGRSHVISQLLGYPDLRIDYDSPFLQKPGSYLENQEYMQYRINSNYFSTGSYKELLHNNGFSSESKPDYVFLELPPIVHNSFPAKLISTADLTVLVCRANRNWLAADQGAIETLKNILPQEPVVLLNGVEMQAVESVLGDLPKKRSRLRRIAKNIVRLQFYSRQQP